jgi:hypothetical protein
MAFAASLLLTLVLAAGIFAGRDRLFAAESISTPDTLVTSTRETAGETAADTAPRIIEISLPGSEEQTLRPRDDEEEAAGAGDDDRRSDRHDDGDDADDDDHDGDDREHEGEDDD